MITHCSGSLPVTIGAVLTDKCWALWTCVSVAERVQLLEKTLKGLDLCSCL